MNGRTPPSKMENLFIVEFINVVKICSNIDFSPPYRNRTISISPHSSFRRSCPPDETQKQSAGGQGTGAHFRGHFPHGFIMRSHKGCGGGGICLSTGLSVGHLPSYCTSVNTPSSLQINTTFRVWSRRGLCPGRRLRAGTPL